MYLIYIPWHFPLHQDPNITGASEAAESALRSEFPAIYAHLSKYKKELSKRNKAETGIRYEWYAMQRWGSNYAADFLKPKIIYPGIMRIAKSNTKNFPRFTLDENEGYFFGNDCYFITGENLDYLWVFLNSTLLGYIFRYYIYSFDETGYKIFTEYFQNIPIPIPDHELLENAKTLRSEPNIDQIDNWIFDLIGFNEDEKDEIRSATDKILGIFSEF